VKVAPYRHIGGAIVADHGPIGLGEARALARFYAREAKSGAQAPALARACVNRARTLRAAARAAARWRLAAGWRLPEEADERRAMQTSGELYT
jgi:hypothetical protein